MGLFGRNKERLTFDLAVAPDTVLPGDTITVTVSVSGAPDPRLGSTLLVFECAGATSGETSVGLGQTVEVDRSFVAHRESVPGPVAPGQYHHVFTVPADAVPSARTTATWAANWRVVLSGRGERGHFVEAPVHVRRRDATGPGRDTIPVLVRDDSPAAWLEIAVPRRLRAGQPVSGTVTVHARRDLEVRRIGLVLESRVVRRGTRTAPLPVDVLLPHHAVDGGATTNVVDRFTKHVDVPAGRVRAGTSLAVPVEYRIPTDDWPTFAGPQSRAHWTLRIAAELAGDADPEVELELDVHNA